MIDFTAAEVASATGGSMLGIDAGATVTRVCLDSREVRPGDLFVAIVGETHDAHDHVAQARERGAVAALVSRPVGDRAIVVDDTVVALGRLARALLERLPACTVVGVTGSSGKTSTKDLIARVLSEAGPTVSPPGSFNNEIGLPLTVLQADEATRFLVLEMGMRGLGHIAYLCGIAAPQIAVVTNVGSAHVELLGSRQGIARAKSELVQALEPTGTAVLNADDALVSAMASATGARVMRFGEAEASDVRALDVHLDDEARASFRLVRAGEESVAVHLRQHGRHNVSNALAAAAVGVAAGIPLAAIARSLSAAEGDSRWRMEVVRLGGERLLINDAYNANPESMAAALRALAAMSGPARRSWAVLGEMREIGPTSGHEHAAIGTLAAELGIDRLVAVGEGARPMVGTAQAGGCSAMWVADVDAAVACVREEAGSGDAILVKASRSIGLERVAVALEEDFGREDGAS